MGALHDEFFLGNNDSMLSSQQSVWDYHLVCGTIPFGGTTLMARRKGLFLVHQEPHPHPTSVSPLPASAKELLMESELLLALLQDQCVALIQGQSCLSTFDVDIY